MLLATSELAAPLPMEFGTIACWVSKHQCFAPFAPEHGYHVTLEDLDSASRTRKLETLHRGDNAFATIPGHRAELVVCTDREQLAALGLAYRLPADPSSFQLLPAVRDLTSRLRLHLFFPTGLRLEGRPDGLRQGEVSFHRRFYPFDTGPLAAPDGVRWLGEGLKIAVPDDPTLLSQIEARFVLR